MANYLPREDRIKLEDRIFGIIKQYRHVNLLKIDDQKLINFSLRLAKAWQVFSPLY